MRSPVSRTLLYGSMMLVLTSLFIFLTPRVEAANGPFNGKIAFQSRRDGNSEIYVMNQDGTGQVRLTNNPATDANPSWARGGTRIVFDSDRNGQAQIFIMNADGSNVLQLTSAGFNAIPAVSPDGMKIAFNSARDGNLEIYVMNIDGANQTRLTNNSASDSSPSWSPDGKKIVFRSNRDGNDEIYIMNADGSNQTNLTNSPTTSDQAPVFSPDGRIVFQRQGDVGLPQIFVMNANGSNLVQLTSNAGGNFSPAVSPDGTKIAFNSARDGDDEIYVMNIDGTNQTRLTNVPGIDNSPDWQGVFSPESIGVFRPSTGQWLLRNTATAGSPDLTFSFGQQGDLPVTGDWNGDGITDIGVYRGNTFFLALLKRTFTHSCLTCPFVLTTTIDPQPSFTFGQAGDLPVAGDWDGDGVDDVGVFRNGQFLLRQPVKLCALCSPIVTTINSTFGQAGDKPVAGDWNGDGIDTIGVFHPQTAQFVLSNSNTAPTIDFATLYGGLAGDSPVVGDWNGDGKDTLGILGVPRNGEAFPNGIGFFLNNSNTVAVNDIVFGFGQPGDIPVAGDWNGPNNPPNNGVNDPSSGSSSVGQTQTFTTTCSDPDGWHDISTIDFKIAKSDPSGNGNGVPIALWVRFEEGSNLVHFYNPDSQTWTAGTVGSNVILSSRFAEINLAQTSVQGSGPTGPSVQITWSIVFKDAAVMNNYKQYLKITDDAGLTTGFDKVGSWSVTR